VAVVVALLRVVLLLVVGVVVALLRVVPLLVVVAAAVVTWAVGTCIQSLILRAK